MFLIIIPAIFAIVTNFKEKAMIYFFGNLKIIIKFAIVLHRFI